MMEGEVTTIDLLGRLVELGRERFTGAIRFENDGIIKILYLKGGDILSASTNDRADSVDELLLRAGKVTREHVKQALAKRKENETLGDALLNLGFITRKELTWGRRVQVISVIRSVRSWTAGTYTIVADYLPKREEGTLFPLHQIIVELVVTEQDRTEFERALAGGTAVFRKAADFDQHYRQLGLNEDADAVAAEIDGERSASEVASLAGRDTFNVYKLLRAFQVLGLIEPTVAAVPAEPVPQFASSSPSSVPVDDLMPAEGFAADADDVWKSSLPGASPIPEEAPAPRRVEEFVEAPTLEIPMQESLPPEKPKTTTMSTPMPKRTQARQTSSRPVLSAPKKSSSRAPLVIVLALLLVGGAAYAGWQWWQSKRSVVPVAQAATNQPAQTKKPAATSTTSTTTAPAPVPSSTTSTAATSTASTTTYVPEPVAVTTKPPVTMKPVTVKPATTKTAKTPVEPAPVAVTLAPAPGKYADMAREYERTANGTYTVQFELVCQESSLAKAVQAGGQKVWFVPISYRGQACYRVFWGRYSTREAAALAVGSIPNALRGASPAIVKVP